YRQEMIHGSKIWWMIVRRLLAYHRCSWLDSFNNPLPLSYRAVRPLASATGISGALPAGRESAFQAKALDIDLVL
ncbi:MAG TPA: hypothetical protein VK140_04565, partial [Ktedonobacteraceae bacterium]|nr:hypothetical protein [Ktedonobacteraceae bacterium]